LEQARRYAQWAPNIAVKLPATAAGLRAMEILAAEGINVVATVSFTVPQCLAIGEAFQRGSERAAKNGVTPGIGIAVLMVGRLDDYLRDVAQDSAADVRESDIIQAGTAAIKRAYHLFKERGYQAVLMPAGCRGAYHITELAGAAMTMSIAPGIAKALVSVEPPFREGIGNTVPADVVRRLSTLREFVKAYDPEGMEPEEFITYGSTNRTLTQFVLLGWNGLENYPIA
ncbi:MAG: transaldolase family protein, partial [Planctomycetes bacterium]|nr:transaldolase family protein [Planctomycetota bacterium]